MHLSDFYFDLPQELIAQYPLPERTDSRLLCLDGIDGSLNDKVFSSLPELLNPGDLLVFNNTKVIPARLFGNKMTGGKLEVLVERVLDNNTFLAQIKSSKSPKPDSLLILGTDKGEGFQVRMMAREGDLFKLQLVLPINQTPVTMQTPATVQSSVNGQTVFFLLDQYGHVPLPPYIARNDEQQDLQRYQTVYAKVEGAVAAPTAGLHFDQALLEKISKKGIDFTYVTLHVGAGTFQPVRVENITAHKMHSEYVDVTAETVAKIKQTHARGGRVIAVGTTAMRSIESASMSGEIQEYHDDTDIFIYPGYRFKTVDALITNFHLPESTLMMLVSAFAGLDNVRWAYQHAIAEKYRFFSYGDAMFLTPAVQSGSSS
jgi:S-adenosylmethionine:tRNA ribosyltransferase-isomerase